MDAPLSPLKKCPSCACTAIVRSRRRIYEYLLPGLRPFRCMTCWRRFLRRVTQDTTTAALAPGAPQPRALTLARQPWYLTPPAN